MPMPGKSFDEPSRPGGDSDGIDLSSKVHDPGGREILFVDYITSSCCDLYRPGYPVVDTVLYW